MRYLNLVLLLGFLGSPLQADTTIFRCVDADGVLTFSDRPCDDTAEVYQSRETLSVVSAPDRLAERVAANRQFIDDRRERLSEARRSPAPGAETAIQERQPAPVPQQPMVLPYWPADRPNPGPTTPPSATDPENERSERFSALGGRQPGSRRRDQSP